MYIQSFQNAAASKITVTGTATNIFDLVNTAGSTTEVNAGFSSRCNAIIIQPEDGDIRVLFNNQVPTATNGFKISNGSIATFCNVPLKSLKLIRTSGSVVCSVQIGISDMSESSSVTGTGAGGAAITSIVPGTGATNLGKAEDAAHTSGDVGVFMLNVRKDTAVSTAGTDGDYAGDISNSTGHKWIAEGFAAQGEDNTNGLIATQNKPVAVSTYAWSVDKSAALEASSIAKATAGVIRSAFGRIDSTHATGTYYVQLMNSATLPADGAVTLLVAPLKIQHVTGTDSNFSIDCTMNGIYSSAGIVLVLSTTEYTKTISGAFTSTTILYI